MGAMTPPRRVSVEPLMTDAEVIAAIRQCHVTCNMERFGEGLRYADWENAWVDPGGTIFGEGPYLKVPVKGGEWDGTVQRVYAPARLRRKLASRRVVPSTETGRSEMENYEIIDERHKYEREEERPGAEPEKASLRRCITRDMYQCTLLAGHDGYHRYEWEDDLASLHRREQSPHSSPERERAQETDAQILHELRSRLAREAESLEQNLADVDRRDWGHARAHARAVIKGHCRVLKTWANGEVPVTRWRERFNESETRLTEAERLLRERLDKHRELYCVDEGEECTCGGWAEIRAFLAESRR